MALDFTNIPDRQGSAAYVLGDGSSMQETQLMDFIHQVSNSPSDEAQVYYFDSTRGDGLKIKEFYQISQFPSVIIVNDDDTLGTSWYGQLPRPEEVRFGLGTYNVN